MGFGERISRSWQLGKQSWRVIRENPELMLFPVISTAVLVLVMAVTAGISFAVFPSLRDGSTADGNNIGGYILLFAFYVVSYTIMIFFNTALVSAVMTALDGGDPSLAGGLGLARARIRPIVGYAVIAATVGVALAVLRDRGGVLGRIAAIVGNVAWGIATYFVTPVLAAESIGPIDAIKRSAALFKKTWGEQVVGGIGLGVFSAVITIPAFLVGGFIILGGFATGSLAGVIPAVIVGGLIIAAALTLVATLGTVFRAALYRYATSGEVQGGFDPAIIEQAFVPKQQRGMTRI